MKVTLYCGRCRQRMTIVYAKNRHGNIYPYFICLGRNNKRTTCDMPYAPVDRVEKLVADCYERITLTPAMADSLRGMLMYEFDQLTAGTNQSIQDLTDRRKPILTEQDKLLEAHLADALSLNQLKKFQTRLRAELDGIEPPRFSAPGPKPGASSNSAMSALLLGVMKTEIRWLLQLGDVGKWFVQNCHLPPGCVVLHY